MQRGPGLQGMGDVGVAQHVRGDPPLDPCTPRDPGQHPSHPRGIPPGTGCSLEQGSGPIISQGKLLPESDLVPAVGLADRSCCGGSVVVVGCGCDAGQSGAAGLGRTVAKG